MSDEPRDLVQGTLDMLILKTLALEPMHGYGVAVRIEQMSKGVFGSTRALCSQRSAAWSARAASRPSGKPRKIAGAQNITP